MEDNTNVGQFIKTSAFVEWVNNLKDRKGRMVILSRIDRFQDTGSPGDAKSVGGGVNEMRIAIGPGYRVYYTVLEDTVILLGGDKSSQARDIRTAQRYAEIWKERSRK